MLIAKYHDVQDVRFRVNKAIKHHETINDNNSKHLSPSVPNAIYPAILADPEIPPSENTSSRLGDDAIFLMMAGTDAPAQVMAISMFHILNTPEVHQRLKTELFNGFPDINTMPTLEELESIPYVVSE